MGLTLEDTGATISTTFINIFPTIEDKGESTKFIDKICLEPEDRLMYDYY